MGKWRTTVGALGASALLAACGGDDGGDFAEQGADEILAAARADMEALTSLRMTGDITSEGESLRVDMAVSTSGDCEGTLSQGDATAEVLSVGGTSYLRPDTTFWELMAGEASGSIVEIVGGRWVIVPPEEGGFSEFCDLDELLDQLDDEEEQDEEATVEGTADVDGREAVELSTTTDEGDPLTVWISAESPHVVLQMEVTTGEEPGLITFSDFDQEIEVEAPAEDEVVDLAALGG